MVKKKRKALRVFTLIAVAITMVFGVVGLTAANAFEWCAGLTEINFNATNCADLPARAFFNAGLDKNGIVVNIGANVTRIPANLFNADAGVSKITAVHFAAGSVLHTIGFNAFANQAALARIIIPATVTTMGTSVFASCNSLTVYAAANSRPSGWNASWNHSNRPVFWGSVFVDGYLQSFSTPLLNPALAPAPTRSGHTFQGWSGTQGGTVEYTMAQAAAITATIDLFNNQKYVILVPWEYVTRKG